MEPLDMVDWEILDATADDCENLEQIYLSVCFEFRNGLAAHSEPTYQRRNHTVMLSEIADRIDKLVKRGLLKPMMDDNGQPLKNLESSTFVWHAWFNMTPAGKSLWSASEHFAEQEQTQ